MTTSLTPFAVKRNRAFVKRRAALLPEGPPVAVGYVRVSTDDQHLGPDAQQAAIADYCVRHGCVLAAVYVDKGVSGRTPVEQRQGFRDALAGVQAHGARLFVVAKVDRLARDLMVACIAEKVISDLGCEFRSAAGEGHDSDDPMSQMMRVIIAGFAAYERTMIALRTKHALRVKIQRVERVGAIKYGFAQVEEIGGRPNGDGVLRRIVPATAEREAAWIATYLAGKHGYGLRAIGRVLDGLGHPTRNGKPWHPQQVSRLLSSPTEGADAAALRAQVDAHIRGKKRRNQRPVVLPEQVVAL